MAREPWHPVEWGLMSRILPLFFFQFEGGRQGLERGAEGGSHALMRACLACTAGEVGPLAGTNSLRNGLTVVRATAPTFVRLSHRLEPWAPSLPSRSPAMPPSKPMHAQRFCVILSPITVCRCSVTQGAQPFCTGGNARCVPLPAPAARNDMLWRCAADS